MADKPKSGMCLLHPKSAVERAKSSNTLNTEVTSNSGLSLGTEVLESDKNQCVDIADKTIESPNGNNTPKHHTTSTCYQKQPLQTTLHKPASEPNSPKPYTSRRNTSMFYCNPDAANSNATLDLLSPPLPLMTFRTLSTTKLDPLRTINNESLPSIENIIPSREADVGHKRDPLGDPLYSKKLSKYFVTRAYKELNHKQNEQYSISCQNLAASGANNIDSNGNTVSADGATNVQPINLFEYTVYESLLHTETAKERSTRDRSRPSEDEIHRTRYEATVTAQQQQSDSSIGGKTERSHNSVDSSPRPFVPSYTRSLLFSGEFESGNIERAVRVVGRETLPLHTTSSYGNSSSGNVTAGGKQPDYASSSAECLVTPAYVDQEYDVTLRKDLNTEGNIQWYYFRVTAGGDILSAAHTATCRSTAAGTADRDETATAAPSGRLKMSPKQGSTNVSSAPITPTTFPLRVRFNIINFQKSDSLYNYGMKPAVLVQSEADQKVQDYEKHMQSFQQQQAQQNQQSARQSPKRGSGVSCEGFSAYASDASPAMPVLQCAWKHSGCEDICYYRNGLTVVKPATGATTARQAASSNTNDTGKKAKNIIFYQYTLTFTYTFTSPNTVYFAHTFPYTYSDLQRYLASLECNSRVAAIMNRKALCKTIGGNACDLLSITERSNGVIEGKVKPCIILSARVHPGEANSSYMMHGLLEFLLGESDEALKLRKTFVFNVVPMLNPDGVIHGNYRCSLAGTDLNRRYLDTHTTLHPTVAALKQFIRATQRSRSVLLYIDLHGHSKLKNCFLYGCDITQQAEKITRELLPLLSEEDITARRVYARIFPRILCTVSKNAASAASATENFRHQRSPHPYAPHSSSSSKNTVQTHTLKPNFSYSDCSFGMDKSKQGTGRVVAYRDLKIAAAYTVEASFCGNGSNTESKILKRYAGNPSNTTVVQSSGYGQSTAASASKSTNTNINSGIKMSKSEPVLSGVRTRATSLGASTANCKDNNDDEDETAQDDIQVKQLPTNNALTDLLESYRTAVHYSKHDLISIGHEIGTAIYHFANLTHSNLENELNIATNALFEAIDATSKAEISSDSKAVNVDTGSQVAASNKSQQNLVPVSETSTLQRKQSKRRASTAHSQALRGSLALAVSAAEALGPGHPPPPLRSPIRQRKLDAALVGADDIETAGDSKDAASLTSAPPLNPSSASAPLRKESDIGNNPAARIAQASLSRQNTAVSGLTGKVAGLTVKIDATAASDDDEDDGDDKDDKDDDVGSDGDSSEENTKPADKDSASKQTNKTSGAGNSSTTTPKVAAVAPPLLADAYKGTAIELQNDDMVHRSVLKPTVFSTDALLALMAKHPDEFTHTDNPSFNIGLRAKIEYEIRRGLNLLPVPEGVEDVAGGVDLSALLSRPTSPLEEQEGSVEGSESDPSADNIPASKMLKNMKKYKDTNSLVVALRKVAVKKRKKEAETKLKNHKKRLKHMAKMENETRKALEEEAALAAAANEAAQNRARLAAMEAALEEARLKAQAQRELNRRPNTASGTRRNSSIFQSSPKHLVPYRLAPEERHVTAPVQIKLVNFKDFDQFSGGGHNNANRKLSSGNAQPPELQGFSTANQQSRDRILTCNSSGSGLTNNSSTSVPNNNPYTQSLNSGISSNHNHPPADDSAKQQPTRRSSQSSASLTSALAAMNPASGIAQHQSSSISSGIVSMASIAAVPQVSAKLAVKTLNTDVAIPELAPSNRHSILGRGMLGSTYTPLNMHERSGSFNAVIDGAAVSLGGNTAHLLRPLNNITPTGSAVPPATTSNPTPAAVRRPSSMLNTLPTLDDYIDALQFSGATISEQQAQQQQLQQQQQQINMERSTLRLKSFKNRPSSASATGRIRKF